MERGHDATVKRGLLRRLIHLLNLRHDCPPPPPAENLRIRYFLSQKKTLVGVMGEGLLPLLRRFSMSDSVRPHRRQPTRLPIPGILQARTLEWVTISFSNA